MYSFESADFSVFLDPSGLMDNSLELLVLKFEYSLVANKGVAFRSSAIIKLVTSVRKDLMYSFNFLFL